MEKRDLPGNDASWYRALLEEDSTKDVPPPTQPKQQLLLTVDEPETSDIEDAVEELENEQANLSTDDPDSDTPLSFAPEDDVDELDETSAGVEEVGQEADATPDLVVQPPQMTGDTEPVHFPEEISEVPEESTPVVAVPPLDETDDPVDNTSEMIGQLWSAREQETPLDDWAPDDMDRKITSSRPFRWTSVIGVLAVIGLIVVGLVLLPSITRNRADSHRDMITSALWDLRSELPDTQASLRTATEPETTVSALNDLSTQLTVLTARASEVDDAGRADLPSAPPFTSSSPIDELAPIQQRLEPLATTAQTIQRRIGNLVEYRSLMSGFMVLPELPTEADGSTQADLRVMLASAQAESASILSDLPSDVSLSEHQEAARSINEMFADWQIDYLEALRAQDPVTAEALVTDLSSRLAELDAQIITPLAQIRRQTDADLIDLARAIDDVIDLANGSDTPS